MECCGWEYGFAHRSAVPYDGVRYELLRLQRVEVTERDWAGVDLIFESRVLGVGNY